MEACAHERTFDTPHVDNEAQTLARQMLQSGRVVVSPGNEGPVDCCCFAEERVTCLGERLPRWLSSAPSGFAAVILRSTLSVLAAAFTWSLAVQNPAEAQKAAMMMSAPC